MAMCRFSRSPTLTTHNLLLNRFNTQDDLLRRFRHLLVVIQTHRMDEDEVADEKWSGLSGLVGYLVQAFL